MRRSTHYPIQLRNVSNTSKHEILPSGEFEIEWYLKLKPVLLRDIAAAGQC